MQALSDTLRAGMAERIAIDHCPVCKATGREHWLAAAGFELVRCRACGHRYSSAVLSSEALAHDYYDEPDAALISRSMAAKTARFEEYLALLGPAAARGRVLDVGCNSGELLSLFQRQGWTPFGIEMSPGPARHAEQLLGARIWRGRVEDVLPPGLQFDLITMSHVLEHIHQPADLIARLRQALSQGGRLLVEVPNADDRLLSLWGGGYRPLCPGDHLSFFDAAHLREILEMCGFAVRDLVSLTHARDLVYPSLLSSVDRVRSALRPRTGDALPGVCGQTRYRGRFRRPLRWVLDGVVEAFDPAVVMLTRSWRTAQRGSVLVAVAEARP
jgi:SAM-dependent methyltransferase